MATTQETTAETIEATAAKLGLTMTAKFVPWSLSRNAGEKEPSLNWKVTILRNGKEIMTMDYMAGCGHCPSHKQTFGKKPYGYDDVIRWECEHGKRGQWSHNRDCAVLHVRMDGPIMPKLADVLHSLAMDADAIEYKDFEAWASEFGYDVDSRKAEATYRACLDIALKLRAAMGDAGLQELREAVSGY